MTKISAHVRSALGSRLFGAWSTSMAARAIALVPLLLFSLDEDAASEAPVHAYIMGFAFVTASSYVWNTVYEYQHLGSSFTKRDSRYLGPTIITAAAFIPYLLSSSPAHFIDTVLLMLAVGMQPVTARLRVASVSGANYKFGYLATGFRDFPTAITALSAFFSTSAVHLIPASLAVGSLLQYIILRYMNPAAPDRARTRALHSGGLTLAALSALTLATYQPLGRLLAGMLPDSTSIALYDIADRPAYMLALVIAGGLATELQRRWRHLPLTQANRELRTASVLAVALMATAALPLALVSLLAPSSSLLSPGTFLPVALPALAANAAYLWSVLRTRLLMGVGAAGRVTISYGSGLLVAIAAWAAFTTLATPTAAHIAVCMFFGFCVAATIQSQHDAIRRGKGQALDS